MFNEKMTKQRLKKLEIYNFLSSAFAVIFFIIPFYLYYKNGEILINFNFLLISIMNISCIYFTYKFSKAIKFKKQQIKHFKNKEKT
jgi:VIT1/CCC1 family predicted Fe2+/Mn2+ transporter